MRWTNSKEIENLERMGMRFKELRIERHGTDKCCERSSFQHGNRNSNERTALLQRRFRLLFCCFLAAVVAAARFHFVHKKIFRFSFKKKSEFLIQIFLLYCKSRSVNGMSIDNWNFIKRTFLSRDFVKDLIPLFFRRTEWK